MPNISIHNPKTKKAIVAGHFCLDLLPNLATVPTGDFFQLFKPGHLLETGKMNVATGGAASNTGISLTKLGIDTTVIARLGNDELSRIAQQHLLRYIQADNVRLNFHDEDSTSYSVIINPPGIDRIFLHHPGANDAFSEKEVVFSDYPDHVLFHYGYPQLMKKMYQTEGQRLVSLFRNAKQAALTTSMDTTLPDPSTEMGQINWDRVLSKTLPYVDIFSPSFEEAFFMLKREDYTHSIAEMPVEKKVAIAFELCDKIIEYGARIAFIKLGEIGGMVRVSHDLAAVDFGKAWYPALVEWKGRTLLAPSFTAKLVGTTGAGDATIAGFLSSILYESSLEEAILMAMAVGGCKVEALDSVSAVRSWDETVQRINQGWKQNNSRIKSLRGWFWQDDFGVLVKN